MFEFTLNLMTALSLIKRAKKAPAPAWKFDHDYPFSYRKEVNASVN